MSSPINVSYITPGAVIVVAAVFPVLSIVAVGLRFYARWLQKIRLLADDWLLVPALVRTLHPRTSIERNINDLQQGLIIGMGIALIIGERSMSIAITSVAQFSRCKGQRYRIYQGPTTGRSS